MVTGFKKQFAAVQKAIKRTGTSPTAAGRKKLIKAALEKKIVEKKKILARESPFFGTREETQARLEKKRENRLRFLS